MIESKQFSEVPIVLILKKELCMLIAMFNAKRYHCFGEFFPDNWDLITGCEWREIGDKSTLLSLECWMFLNCEKHFKQFGN